MYPVRIMHVICKIHSVRLALGGPFSATPPKPRARHGPRAPAAPRPRASVRLITKQSNHRDAEIFITEIVLATL